MRRLTLLLLILPIAFRLSAAQTPVSGKISGTIKDNTGAAMEFTTTMLLSTQDSSLVKGAITDEGGNFSFEQIGEGTYLIAATQVGFEKMYTAPFTISKTQTDLTLPTLIMIEDVKLLNEIVVETTKPFIEQEIDKMVINVENSIVSSGSNAMEVLEKVPGVTIDRQNEDIQLRGKKGVIVMIDGKQTYLSGQDVANLLKNTPSENIEKIEVITNPSSKYDAAGNTGIINIKMKKNKNFGTNGSATLGAGYGRFEKSNASIQLNNRSGKMNTFGNYSYNNNKALQENEIQRVIPYEGNLTYFDQVSYRPNQFIGHNYRAGIDYFASSKSTFGVMVTGFSNSWKQFDAVNHSFIRNQNGEITLKPTTEVDVNNTRNNITGNVNYKYAFTPNGRELTLDMDYSRYENDAYNKLSTEYTDANDHYVRPSDIVRSTMPSSMNIYAFKADYVHPFENGSKLETGIKSSAISSDNNLTFENFQESKWLYDETRSNHFKYQENINAAYINYSGKFNEKTTYQLGLRAEQTHSEGNSITLNQVVDREYLNLFPTLFLSRQIDSSNVVNFSYSRRIDRPNYQDLNPFVFYLDPYTFQKGNPFLQPQLTNSLQLTHTYKGKLITTLGFSKTTDVIVQEVPGQIAEENITFVQTQNLASQENVNLTISFPIKVKNWWNIQTNFTGVYNKYDSPYLGGQINLDAMSWNAYVGNNFVLGEGFSAEVSGWYNSAGIYGFFKSEPMGAFSLGIQKTMLDKKLTVKANINDPLFLNRFKGAAKYQDIDIKVKARWDSRVARLTLTYNFGNQNVKGARQRSTSTEAERNRAGGN